MAWTREQMCERASRELEDGFYVNLGIGMPTLVANYISAKNNITLQSENGMLGMGPFPKKGEEDPDLINAGKQTITSLADSSLITKVLPSPSWLSTLMLPLCFSTIDFT